MDDKQLKSFKNKIGENDLILKIYRDRSGKNKWSIICSALDWIEVALSGIDTSTLSSKNDHQASIKMMTFISCVDVMWEAIQQLHRVLFETDKIPFKQDCSVFKKSVSDNEYFKIIRACFAAHPVNLRNVYPDDEKGEHWYASWSGKIFSRQDFSVILYSNSSEREPRFFDVRFEEIYEFAEKRYQYLSDLMKRIDLIKNEYLESFRRIPIDIEDTDTESISVLIAENKKRLDCDCFDYELQKIRRVYQTDYKETEKNNFAMNEYKRALKDELDELRSKLQKMEFGDLMNQVNDDVPLEIQYDFSELSGAVLRGTRSCLPLDFPIEKVKTGISDVVDIDESMTAEELYVLVCAGAYLINRGKILKIHH